jgi:DNA processing protein
MKIELYRTENIAPQLLELHKPPNEVYVAGNINVLQNNRIITIVGSRKHTPYAKDIIEQLISSISEYPIAIVSGLAFGIDTFTHKTALKYSLPTIAIPGSGLAPSHIHPRSNLNLANEILRSGGLLLSEYPPETKAARWTFPQRNQLLAGISDITIIVEAGGKSGSLITARFAMELGKSVLAVPGSIFSPNSKGCHSLIEQGARIYTGVDTLLDELDIQKNFQKQLTINFESLPPKEKEVLELLKIPMRRSDLIENSGLSVSESQTLLMKMEIKGLIREELGLVHRCK